MKKMLILAEFYSNYPGNFIPSLICLENLAVENGYQVQYVFSNKNSNPKFFEWEVPFSKEHDLKLMNFQNKKFDNDIANLIKRESIDVVYYHFGSSLLLSKIKHKSPKSTKFFQHIHNSMCHKHNLYAFLKRIRNYFFLDRNIVKICCSQSIYSAADYIFPGSKILVCKNAIDLKRLVERDRNDINQFNILMMGHNFFTKGVDLAIKAVTELSKSIPIHLDVVMGDKMEENSKIIENLFGDVSTQVSILEPTNDVSKLYTSHQVFLNASNEEGMSYANIEAYYCGALFICSDIPQNLEPNLPHAITFKTGDYLDLMQKIKISYELKNIYKNDTDYVKENFSLEVWAKKIFEIISNH